MSELLDKVATLFNYRPFGRQIGINHFIQCASGESKMNNQAEIKLIQTVVRG